MEGEEEASDDPRALSNQGFWKKLIIFAAGALMNFLTGLMILLVLYGGAKAFYSPTITGFADGCPLQSESGLQVGDELLSIDGERVYVYSDVGLLFSLNKDGMFDLVVRRDGQKVKLTDFPMEQREYADQSGGTYTGYGLFFGAKEAGFTDRVKYSWNNAMDFVRLVRLSLKMLVTGQAGISDLSGRSASSRRSRTWRAVGFRTGGGGEHRLFRGADRGEPRSDEPAAAARARRREDFLPRRERRVYADHPEEDSGEIRKLRPPRGLRAADAPDGGHHVPGRLETIQMKVTK